MGLILERDLAKISPYLQLFFRQSIEIIRPYLPKVRSLLETGTRSALEKAFTESIVHHIIFTHKGFVIGEAGRRGNNVDVHFQLDKFLIGLEVKGWGINRRDSQGLLNGIEKVYLCEDNAHRFYHCKTCYGVVFLLTFPKWSNIPDWEKWDPKSILNELLTFPIATQNIKREYHYLFCRASLGRECKIGRAKMDIQQKKIEPIEAYSETTFPIKGNASDALLAMLF